MTHGTLLVIFDPEVGPTLVESDHFDKKTLFRQLSSSSFFTYLPRDWSSSGKRTNVPGIQLLLIPPLLFNYNPDYSVLHVILNEVNTGKILSF